MKELFFSTILPILLTALGGVAVWAIGLLATWLHEKAKSSKLARVGAVVTDLANSVVAELNATLKPQLAAALADGKLTDEEKAKLKSTALEILKTKLPTGLQSLAASFFGEAVDTWLAGHVERAVTTQAAITAPPLVSVPMLTAPLVRSPLSGP